MFFYVSEAEDVGIKTDLSLILIVKLSLGYV